MTAGPSRLRVVGGLDAAPTPKAKRRRPRQVPMKDQLVPFKCTKCSEEAGFDNTMLVQVVRTPHEANGKLVAGHLWWACARCLTPYYRIKMYGAPNRTHAR